ncbi:MAG: hypothetical protein AAF824_16580 [Bacteroidota bacterium]
MTFEEFTHSLSQDSPPANLSLALQALWYAHKEDWNKAHDLADTRDEQGGAWVHAYLHREEGDQWNAEYWYRRARKPVFEGSLEEEWEHIAKELIRLS